MNSCPGCQIALANEQVLSDGTGERSGYVVERRLLEQWFLRITQYADEILAALDSLDWPDRVKTMQRNWIGRSDGALLRFPVEGHPDTSVEVFTTLGGDRVWRTYVVLAPEQPLSASSAPPTDGDAVTRLCRAAWTGPERQRMEADISAEKRGAQTGGAIASTRSRANRCRSTSPTTSS